MGRHALTLLATLNTECDNIEQLTAAATEAFRQRPDYEAAAVSPRAAPW